MKPCGQTTIKVLPYPPLSTCHPGSKFREPCIRCGRTHNRRDCPAWKKMCRKHSKNRHFAAKYYYRTKNIAIVENIPKELTKEDAIEPSGDTGGMGDNFLNAMTASSEPSSWTAKVYLGEQQLHFQLDTHVEVTAISDTAHKEHGSVVLLSPSMELFVADNTQLQVLGQFSHLLQYKNQTTQKSIFVIKGLKTKLLGLPVITALQLVVRLDFVESYRARIAPDYLTVFDSLEILGAPDAIEMKPSVKLHAVWHVSHRMREKVKEALAHMEARGVITKLDQPTTWCAGKVAVPNKSGTVCICVDLKPLNQSVCRGIHPMPMMDDIISQLTGANFFPKFNGNSGFWQIPLSPASKHFTFKTPCGCCHLNYSEEHEEATCWTTWGSV